MLCLKMSKFATYILYTEKQQSKLFKAMTFVCELDVYVALIFHWVR